MIYMFLRLFELRFSKRVNYDVYSMNELQTEKWMYCKIIIKKKEKKKTEVREPREGWYFTLFFISPV